MRCPAGHDNCKEARNGHGVVFVCYLCSTMGRRFAREPSSDPIVVPCEKCGLDAIRVPFAPFPRYECLRCGHAFARVKESNMGDGSVEKLRIAHNKLADEVTKLAERVEVERVSRMEWERRRTGTGVDLVAREQLCAETMLSVLADAARSYAAHVFTHVDHEPASAAKKVGEFVRELHKGLFGKPEGDAQSPDDGMPLDADGNLKPV